VKDTLKRLFGGPTPAEAESKKEDVTMTIEDVKPDATVDASANTVATLTASLEAVTTELASANAKIAELTALVDAATAFKAAAEREAAELKATARKEKLVAAVGTEKADALMAATASMDDTAFGTLVAAMTTTLTVEAAQPTFREVGVEGEASKEGLDVLATASKNVLAYLKTNKAE
jgi:hypothetical protein